MLTCLFCFCLSNFSPGADAGFTKRGGADPSIGPRALETLATPLHRADGNCKGGGNPEIKSYVDSVQVHDVEFSVGGNGLGFRDPAWGHRVIGRVSCQSGGASVDISFPEYYASA